MIVNEIFVIYYVNIKYIVNMHIKFGKHGKLEKGKQ